MNRTSITKFFWLAYTFLLFLITACTPSPKELAFQTQEAATATAAIWTEAPTATQTLTPTITPSPTITPTPSPTFDLAGTVAVAVATNMAEKYGNPHPKPTKPPAPKEEDILWLDSEEDEYVSFAQRVMYGNEIALDLLEWDLECAKAGYGPEQCGDGFVGLCSELPFGALHMRVVGLDEAYSRLVSGDVTYAEELPGFMSDYFLNYRNRYSNLDPDKYSDGEYCAVTEGMRTAFPEHDFGPRMCVPDSEQLPCDLYLSWVYSPWAMGEETLIGDMRSEIFRMTTTASDLSSVKDNRPANMPPENPLVDNPFYWVTYGSYERWRIDIDTAPPSYGNRFAVNLMLIQSTSGVRFYVQNYSYVSWTFNDRSGE